jgi:hypothetical protein
MCARLRNVTNVKGPTHETRLLHFVPPNAPGHGVGEHSEDPVRYAEYAERSRAGIPAVDVLVHDLKMKFPEIANNHFAKQAIGAFVGNVMRAHDHTIVRRGRVAGGFFTNGAIWSAFPLARSGAGAGQSAPGHL